MEGLKMMDVARALGMQLVTLQNWKRRGYVIPSVPNPAGGRDRFSADDVRRLKLILALVNVGVSAQSAAEISDRASEVCDLIRSHRR